MDVRALAQKLIDELVAGSEKQRQQAEGVALFYNRLVESQDAETKKKQEEEKRSALGK